MAYDPIEYWRRASLFGVGIVACFGLIAVIGPQMCPVPKALLTTDQITSSLQPNCLEFWFNRYQTLLGVIGALIAARYAWLGVQRQIAVANKQLDIALGDVPPDIWLDRIFISERDDALFFRIAVVNHNRRPLIVTEIALTEPGAAALSVERVDDQGRGKPLGTGAVANTQRFRETVQGTRPSAPEAPQMTFQLALYTAAPADGPHPDRASFRVRYEMFGLNDDPRTVSLSWSASEDE
ncbi:hypothetical protein [Methylobacterium oxalidis]|uniref:Uncharacterized protein n=1 Tax=Methylobacterium oxalidis TaxID=944322 RepID=A0A512J975_9HYPH|nr:hypothetical protein [Methylobacterium oxalidis]GEP06465.1 hypothetical protein MOX02_45030 [Methylobacterium oxalidis]GJE33511.1 hypothetical protein LDDCCGHA_3711 [Methylobacterium oxalidis]GLS65505.1 hypothetical protein GCM10007888_38870 [Methylobacterium oxalidis]